MVQAREGRTKTKPAADSPPDPIEEARAIAHRTGLYAGIDLPKYAETSYMPHQSATVTVYRMVEGERRAFSATADYAEYAPGADPQYRDVKPMQWLAECAELLALQKAFPATERLSPVNGGAK